MSDQPRKPRRLPARVNLAKGYNPALDPTVKALTEVPTDDEALRNELERRAIENSDNGPKATDRADADQEPS